MDEKTAKQWARIQEGLLNLEEYAAALERLMDRNPTTVMNPARKAMRDALDKRISAARQEILELKGDLSSTDKDLLYQHLEDIRSERRTKAS
jgi:hypothetical protein